MLKRVDVVVEHDGCWTSHIPATARTINLEVYPHKDYLRSRILIDSPDKLLLNSMKAHKSIVKIIKIHKFHNGLYIDFLNKYKGSLAGLLYDNEVLILDNIIEGGKEKWSFVSSNKNLKEIISQIESLGKVHKMEITDFNPILYPSLTEWEKKSSYDSL